MSGVTPPEPSWRLRRRAVFGSMLFGGFVVLWTMLRGEDTRLAETLALGGFGLIASVVAFYSGTAVYQDVRFRQVDRAAYDGYGPRYDDPYGGPTDEGRL